MIMGSTVWERQARGRAAGVSSRGAQRGVHELEVGMRRRARVRIAGQHRVHHFAVLVGQRRSVPRYRASRGSADVGLQLRTARASPATAPGCATPRRWTVESRVCLRFAGGSSCRARPSWSGRPARCAYGPHRWLAGAACQPWHLPARGGSPARRSGIPGSPWNRQGTVPVVHPAPAARCRFDHVPPPARAVSRPWLASCAMTSRSAVAQTQLHRQGALGRQPVARPQPCSCTRRACATTLSNTLRAHGAIVKHAAEVRAHGMAQGIIQVSQ